MPRLWSLNSGLNKENGNVDYEHWFKEEGMDGLEILGKALDSDEALRAAQAKLNSSSEDVKGMARRSVIFRVTSPLQRPDAQPTSTPSGRTTWEMHRWNMTPLP